MLNSRNTKNSSLSDAGGVQDLVITQESSGTGDVLRLWGNYSYLLA